MKTLIAVLMLAGMMSGQCGEYCKATPQTIRAMNVIAKSRHLKWDVFCTANNRPDRRFMARVLQAGDSERGSYIEDGALPWWGAFGGTQEAALQGVMSEVLNEKPMQREHSPAAKMKQCNTPPLSGGER